LVTLVGVTLFIKDDIQSISGVNKKGSEVTENTANNVPVKALADWKLILVNTENPIPEDYTLETRPLPNGLTFDTRAYDNLIAMLNDGKNEGLTFVVCSAYRTIELQTSLFKAQVAKQQHKGLSDKEAYNVAKTIVALPGTSEHNVGLAVDIVALDYQRLDDGYADTPEAIWLKQNSDKYGFILRYPANKEKTTKIMYEPWHFRYVGTDHALEMNRLNLCLEEYIEYLRDAALAV